jgi:hypothetical protein
MSRDIKFDRGNCDTEFDRAPNMGTVWDSWFHGTASPRFSHAASHPSPDPSGDVPVLATGLWHSPDRHVLGSAVLHRAPFPPAISPPRSRRHPTALPAPLGHRGRALRDDADRCAAPPRTPHLGCRPDPSPAPVGDAGSVCPLGANAATLVPPRRPDPRSGGAATGDQSGPSECSPRDLADGCKRAY